MSANVNWLFTLPQPLPATSDLRTHFGFRYDHLSKVLTRVLDEKPPDVVDIIEDISKETKRTQFVSNTDTMRDKIDDSTEVALCQIQEKLYQV